MLGLEFSILLVSSVNDKSIHHLHVDSIPKDQLGSPNYYCYQLIKYFHTIIVQQDNHHAICENDSNDGNYW